ncbi:MAG: hypothetical protein L3V56_09840 [Candidatus Magnetoovum sp. WYHC-5]|nr:hypothetical protein [Candidatus Magnetoovum sp. WYHC-5]
MEYKFKCKCGAEEVSVNFKNEIMPPELLIGLYCPRCSQDVTFEPQTMVKDNGWIMEYEMDVARLMAKNLPADIIVRLSPELIFDEDYCSWRGIYPGDHIDSLKEKEQILAIAKVDPRRYLEEIKHWANNRMDKLRKEGWRKAHERVAV